MCCVINIDITPSDTQLSLPSHSTTETTQTPTYQRKQSTKWLQVREFSHSFHCLNHNYSSFSSRLWSTSNVPWWSIPSNGTNAIQSTFLFYIFSFITFFFITQTEMQSGPCVVLIHNIPEEYVSTERIFNFCCPVGNICKVIIIFPQNIFFLAYSIIIDQSLA